MTGYFSSYITGILTVAVCAFLCESITSLKSSGPLSNASRFVTSLCIFIAVLLPIGISLKNADFSFLHSFTPKNEHTENTETFIKLTENRLEAEITSIISNEFGIIPKDVSINLNTESGKIFTETVTVVLKESEKEHRDEILKFVNNFDCKSTDVIIDRKESSEATTNE